MVPLMRFPYTKRFLDQFWRSLFPYLEDDSNCTEGFRTTRWIKSVLCAKNGYALFIALHGGTGWQRASTSIWIMNCIFSTFNIFIHYSTEQSFFFFGWNLYCYCCIFSYDHGTWVINHLLFQRGEKSIFK